MNATDHTPTTRRHRKTIGTGLTACGALAIGGLVVAANATSAGAAPEPVAAPPPVADSSSVELPLDVLGRGDTEFDQRMHVEMGAALEACAAAVDVAYSHPSAPETVKPITDLFGLADVEHASERGYLPPQGFDARSADVNPVAALSTADQATVDTVFWGSDPDANTIKVTDVNGNYVGGATPGNGCIYDFYVSFFGSEDAYADYTTSKMGVIDAQLKSESEMLKSAEYEKVLSQWRACMNDQGVSDAANPGELFERDWGTERPSREETLTAVADVECKASVGFADRMVPFLATTQTNLVESEGLDSAVTALDEMMTTPS